MMRGPVQRVAAQAPMSKQEDDPEQEVPAWPDLVAKRDFLGAVTLLQVKKSDDDPIKVKEWLAYCHFHAGQYEQACTVYQALLAGVDPDPAYHAQLAACYFYMGKYELSEETALKGPDSQLKKRVLVHCAHASGSEDKLVEAHGKLDKRLLEDQLSLAAVHFRRSHFQEATDIYKRLLLENKTFLALNVFIALCYSRLDYYDISQEILKQYLSKVPDSVLAVNLKACNTFRLSNGRAAEEELQQLKSQMAVNLLAHDLIRHNLVVFRGGENALRDLQPLLGVIPEARLNLVIFHLRKGDTQIAFDLIKGLEASLPQEYILQGVVHAALGQQKQDAEMLKAAQQYFQLVGASASECDTIPGRQCMASCFHLLGQFDDVLIFLNSIAQYFKEDDDFAWNFGLALANTGSWAEAAEALQGIKNEAYLKDYWLQAWLARCHIMRKRPDAAWQLYVENADTKDSYRLLHVIADECYGMGHFDYSAKAFQVLERLDPDGKYYEGKRGACIGFVQQMIAKHKNASPDKLDEILAMLQDSNDPGAADIVSTLQGWASAGGLIH